MYLQSYVFPIVLFDENNKLGFVKEVIGTASIIGSNGVFLTAKHVIESAVSNAKHKNLQVGCVVKLDNGMSENSQITRIQELEFAPEPFDIAIGVIEYKCESKLTLDKNEVAVWQEVATFGYPLNAVSGDPNSIKMNIRCHKGIVQRVLAPGDVPIGNNPNAFELDFLLGRGISGAPLFISNSPKDLLIGICVGSIRSELIEDEILEVIDQATTYKETKVKVEEYGIAHDIRPLHDWKPKFLSGKSLYEASVE